MSNGGVIKNGSEPAFPSTYEICVDGRLSQEGASWFEGMMCGVNEEALTPQTLIRGEVTDSAALYGLISRLRDLGLILVSVQRLATDSR
jgi:hypothetical protein